MGYAKHLGGNLSRLLDDSVMLGGKEHEMKELASECARWYLRATKSFSFAVGPTSMCRRDYKDIPDACPAKLPWNDKYAHGKRLRVFGVQVLRLEAHCCFINKMDFMASRDIPADNIVMTGKEKGIFQAPPIENIMRLGSVYYNRLTDEDRLELDDSCPYDTIGKMLPVLAANALSHFVKLSMKGKDRVAASLKLSMQLARQCQERDPADLDLIFNLVNGEVVAALLEGGGETDLETAQLAYAKGLSAYTQLVEEGSKIAEELGTFREMIRSEHWDHPLEAFRVLLLQIASEASVKDIDELDS